MTDRSVTENDRSVIYALSDATGHRHRHRGHRDP
jgi:hypothetical protein